MKAALIIENSQPTLTLNTHLTSRISTEKIPYDVMTCYYASPERFVSCEIRRRLGATESKQGAIVCEFPFFNVSARLFPSDLQPPFGG